MLAEFKRKTNIGIGAGFLTVIFGRVILKDGGDIAIIGAGLVVAGWVMFIWGCMQYAKAKGHSGAWGLLGLLSILGLIVLFFFPDRHKEPPSA